MGAEPAPELDLALRALADANRRAILSLIRTEPRPVGSVAEQVGLSQQAASHHLGVLRDAGLATRTREGTRHLFAVNTDGLAAVRTYLDDFWPDKLSALKAAVETRKADDRG
ncbi:MAG: metalloregulator ArsR/SmtB family transcription factor [Actinomycetia bacterium]|nr:metalloregulator ArsR/SmtB family transcription factor [Actinomycetes bacterium]